MSSIDEKIIEIRKKGINSLKSVLSKQQNIKVIEKNIHNICKTNDEYISTYTKILYQIIGDILNNTKLPIILDNLKKELVCWKHPFFSNIKFLLQEHDDFIINPFEVEEGVLECNKCGSKRTYTYQKNTRGCDEPATTFAQCLGCNTKWTYSG
jgi:DNA-directed RNA polymerase subunit M/transcription elongation factor TFIIS